MAKSITHCQGNGSLTHNNRTFTAKNVDSSRTGNNIVFVKQPIDVVYDEIFSAAVERYNAKQKRSDRKITTSYYEHLSSVLLPRAWSLLPINERVFMKTLCRSGRKMIQA